MNTISVDFFTYAKWSGILTLALLLLTILGFVLGWGIRFRLVGVTSFLTVLTAGLFTLKLGLFTHTVIPGAVRFSLVYDSGATQAVIVVPPKITESELEATLRQAASDLYSSGRNSVNGEDKLTIRARALIHPKPGLTIPLYVGQVKQALGTRNDDQLEIDIFRDRLAKLNSGDGKA
jgi:hypothetical protein